MNQNGVKREQTEWWENVKHKAGVRFLMIVYGE